MRFLLALSLLLAGFHAVVAQDGRSSVVGTWELLAFESRDSAGATTYPLGRRPKGVLIYDQAHWVVAQLLIAFHQAVAGILRCRHQLNSRRYSAAR